MLRTWLALIASAVFLVRLTPQPVRLARDGVAAGVSPLAALNAFIAAAAWSVYGLVAGLPAVWIVSVLALVPSLWAVVLLRAETRRRDLALAGVWVAVIGAAAAVGLLGAVLGAGVVVSAGPQVVRALRDDDVSGIAPATWWMSLPDALSWGAYGLVIGDRALVGYGVVLASCAVVVLVRLRFGDRPAWTSPTSLRWIAQAER